MLMATEINPVRTLLRGLVLVAGPAELALGCGALDVHRRVGHGTHVVKPGLGLVDVPAVVQVVRDVCRHLHARDRAVRPEAISSPGYVADSLALNGVVYGRGVSVRVNLRRWRTNT